MFWQTSQSNIPIDRPLVMGILNLTPDSFSDGGSYVDTDEALLKVERMIAEGADIIDVGGESTRPGGAPVGVQEEIDRTCPVILSIFQRFDIPISIDTSKSEVAAAAIEAGAEIVNDVSGLRFDDRLALLCGQAEVGIVLMHSRGEFNEMHSQDPIKDIYVEIERDLRRSVSMAINSGIRADRIVLDIGLGFGKTYEQNLQLLAGLEPLRQKFPEFPLMIGASRKSFIGRATGEADPGERLGGSIAAAVIGIISGAQIVRVHDVKETVSALRFVEAVATVE